MAGKEPPVGKRPTQPNPRPATWRDHPDAVRPTVLIIGGFLTVPPLYRGLARRLLDRGAAGVVVARVWTPDWMLVAVRGPGAVATRSGKALLAAGRLAAEVSEGAPVLAVGHSAGGLVARILTAPEPVCGRRFAAAGRIGAIVTLGTPHSLAGGGAIGRPLHSRLTSIADEAAPGTLHSPKIGYVSVASRAIRGDPRGAVQERAAQLLYPSIVGPARAAGAEGDGLVPLAAAVLPGSRAVILDDAVHGPTTGAPWYGSDSSLDAWWPEALAAWHAALAARSG
jgi:hypothetical protein